jgi:hypothetical protein
VSVALKYADHAAEISAAAVGSELPPSGSSREKRR